MNRKGFTLVEILIVVIILGILAAIVIPQFTEASNDARESALASDLQTARSQIELYKVQHLDGYPTSIAQLTSRTNQSSTVMPADGSAADYPYGPYLQKFPTNPFVTGGTNDEVEFEAGATKLGGGNYGWHFDSTTGRLSPDDDDHKTL